MMTLGINTASSHTGIALLENGKLIAEDSWESENDEADKLMPAITKLCKKLDQQLAQLEQVVVISGPGSFTGLRIGVTVANTLAYLTKAKLYAITTFDYWKQKKIPGENLLIFAGSKGLYVNGEITPLDKVKITGTAFGDITDEQKSQLNVEFLETTETFGQTLEKIELTTPVKLVVPNYVKKPSITKSKKCYT